MKGLFLLLPIALSLGCATNDGRERGRDGTVAYTIKVETSHPGVRIEADNDYVGEAPLELKVFGDPDGTFHNFGSSDYVIRALPSGDGQQVQSKVFRTGGWFSQEDRIPKRIYFDMKQERGFSLDVRPRY